MVKTTALQLQDTSLLKLDYYLKALRSCFAETKYKRVTCFKKWGKLSRCGSAQEAMDIEFRYTQTEINTDGVFCFVKTVEAYKILLIIILSKSHSTVSKKFMLGIIFHEVK